MPGPELCFRHIPVEMKLEKVMLPNKRHPPSTDNLGKGKSTFNVLAQLRLRTSFSAGDFGLTFLTKGGGVIHWDDTSKVTHPEVDLTRPTLTALPLNPLLP